MTGEHVRPVASPETWRRTIDQAWSGDPRHLLELLLRPTMTDSQENPLPGSFVELPDDGELRLAIVNVLMRGPWGIKDSMADLMTKTGFGKGKPKLSDLEVSFAAVFQRFGATEERMASIAEAHGVTLETLRKRIAKQSKAKRT